MNDKQHPTPILATTKLAADLDQIVASTARRDSKWCEASLSKIGTIPNVPGVYCFVLPESELPKERILTLHGRTFGPKTARRQLQFRFNYSAEAFREGAGMVIYVGKAANLRARVKGHLSVNAKATTNQVLRGLVGGPHTAVTHAALKQSLNHLREHGAVFYLEHHHPDEKADHRTKQDVGESYVAERDLLEIKLVAKYAPPFNIKAER